MSDPETLAVYAKVAREYADDFAKPKDTFHDPDFDAFAGLVRPGGHVLDLGCGPGHWAARLATCGFQVSATDASQAMVDLARADFGIDAKVAPFEGLTEIAAAYDGIWANFSLLHAPRVDFPGHLAQIHKALKPGGAFHLGMKIGGGEGRDRLGRFYAYYGEDELKSLLDAAGFTVARTRVGNGKGLAGGEETFIVLTAHA